MKLISLAYWFLLILIPLPSFYFLFNYSLTLDRLIALDEQLENIHARKNQVEAVQKREHSALSSLAQSDPFYIDKHLETLIFLEPEIKKIESLFADTQVDETIQKRLHFLKNTNRFLLAEDKIRSKEKLREVFEKQQQPVEIDEEDLKKLLALIEGVTIWPYGPKEGRPQIIIQDFSLSKKQHRAQDHVFVVNMNLIKRENP